MEGKTRVGCRQDLVKNVEKVLAQKGKYLIVSATKITGLIQSGNRNAPSEARGHVPLVYHSPQGPVLLARLRSTLA